MTLEYRCSECGARLQTSAVQPEAAALIDAAPEMLEVLNAARIILKNRDQRPEEVRLLDAIKIVIAKATHQSPTSAMSESK